jgi:hypothetical protein
LSDEAVQASMDGYFQLGYAAPCGTTFLSG